jgi:low affinity Fe/Cu permease
MSDLFRKLANRISTWTGTAWAFLLALTVVVVWAVTGPAFNFSSTWQLVINTGTTIVTFLMVFLIQNTQNRDGKAIQLKLDELIRSSTVARDALVDVEDLTDEELAELDQEFKDIREQLSPSSSIHKLHSKIEAEHKRRLSLRSAGHAIGQMLKPDKQ